VDKDFITQCDWLAWHRLTWANDTKVVKRVLGGDYADQIEDLNTGESFLVTDWDESIRRVQFRKKHTFDAGATPGFGETRDPDLKPVPQEWVEAFDATKFKKDPEGVEDGVDAAPDRDPSDEEVAETQVVEDSGSDDQSSSEQSDEDTGEVAATGGASDDSRTTSARKSTSSDREIIQEHDGPGVHTGTRSNRRSSRASGRNASRSYSADLAEQLDAMDEWVGSKSPRVARATEPPADAQSVAWELGQMVVFVGKAMLWGVFAALYFVVRHVVGALLFLVTRLAGGLRAGYRRAAGVSQAGGRRARAASQAGGQRSGSALRLLGRRVANGLRAVGRPIRQSAGRVREFVAGPHRDQSRVIVGGRDEPDDPRSDGGEEQGRPVADLLVGSFVALGVTLVAVATLMFLAFPSALPPIAP
jgi:hypothetical protein